MPTTEFIQSADYILGAILHYMLPQERQIAESITYIIDDSPTSWQRQATGTPEGYILLGMYEWAARRVTIFEKSLRSITNSFETLKLAIDNTLRHEIWEHLFGLDHTKDTEDAGLVPALAISPDGQALRQWELAKPCG